MRHIPIQRDEAHVWRARLDVPEDELDALAAALADDERARAERRVFPHHRRRALASRGLLRAVLAAYLECSPAEVPLAVGPHGKPRLAAGDLELNLAHADDLALVAVARGRPVGVDLERIDRRIEIDAIAERFFAPGERAALAALPEGYRAATFFEIWTRKEAYLKARGDGLNADLAAFAVSPGPAPRLDPIGDAADADGWTLHGLEPAPGFVGALCVRGRDAPAVSLREWPPA